MSEDPVARQLAAEAAVIAQQAFTNSTTSAAVTEIRGEVPAGVIDGANPVFTLANSPTAAGIALFRNGLRCGPADFTLAGTTVTLTTPPAVGEVIFADYRHT